MHAARGRGSVRSGGQPHMRQPDWRSHGMTYQMCHSISCDISDVSQHKLRDIAMASLDLMIEEMGAHCPPLSFESKEQG